MKYQFGWAFPDTDEFMINEIEPDGSYQASHLRIALSHVTDHDLAVDGGSHCGTWARLMSRVFGRVIAVEPSADTIEALHVNMATFNCANVEIKHVALGSAPGRVSMVLDGRGATLKNTGARHVGPGSDVAVETIDSWDLPSLGFLKLDVEGSEPMALRGAKATIARCRPIILFEDKNLWKTYREQRDAPQQILTKLGYREICTASMDRIWGPQ